MPSSLTMSPLPLSTEFIILELICDDTFVEIDYFYVLGSNI